MSTWNSRGLRGSLLEEMVNMTNQKYRDSGLALIQKVPTPITPITIDKETRHITLAYFDQKSTVDYIGAVQNQAGSLYELNYGGADQLRVAAVLNPSNPLIVDVIYVCFDQTTAP